MAHSSHVGPDPCLRIQLFKLKRLQHDFLPKYDFVSQPGRASTLYLPQDVDLMFNSFLTLLFWGKWYLYSSPVDTKYDLL